MNGATVRFIACDQTALTLEFSNAAEAYEVFLHYKRIQISCQSYKHATLDRRSTCELPRTCDYRALML